jgi:hypothetical protein
MGYGGWSLYFAPEIVQAVVDFAARLPDDAETYKAYQKLGRLLTDLKAQEPSQLVFQDVVEAGSGGFRKSELPAMTGHVSSGWVACPYCGMRFLLSDPRRWDGERHTTCGQRIIINAA